MLTWEAGPSRPSMTAEDVHVWAVRLDAPPAEVAICRQYLSNEEKERADRSYFAVDSYAFILARGHLRLLLGRYLDFHPGRIGLTTGDFGKPALMGGGLEFNIAHSGSVALLAFSPGRELGVDVERIRPESVNDPLAKRVFSPGAYAQYRDAPEEMKTTLFFNCWTRKEALIKAMGKGLSFPLHAFDVSVLPDDASLLSLDGNDAADCDWQLRALKPCSHYAAALAIKGGGWRLSCFAFPEKDVCDTSASSHVV